MRAVNGEVGFERVKVRSECRRGEGDKKRDWETAATWVRPF